MFSKQLSKYFGVVLLLLNTSVAEAQTSIVDYYNELRRVKSFGLNYPVQRQGNKWVTINQVWKSQMPAIVDLCNGYIFVSDEGTGGGNFETQVVLWRLKRGAPLIGVSESGYDPPYPDQTKIRFFDKSGNKWQVTTTHVWPKITISDFLLPNMSVKDLRTLKKIGSSVYFRLPRRGTTIRAFLVVKDNITKAVCKGAKWINVGDKTPYLYYCSRLAKRLYRRIDVVWTKDEGRFRIGAKSRKRLQLK